MSVQLRKVNDALIQTLLYINSEDLLDEELKSIGLVFEMILAGEAAHIISEKQKNFLDIRSANIVYFQKNPHDYITVLGDSKIKQQILVGLFQSFGIERKHLKLFTDYDQLKKRFPFPDVNHKHNKGVLFGSVPHSVSGLNGYPSPTQAIEAVGKHQGFIVYKSKELRITKENVKEFVLRVSTSLHH